MAILKNLGASEISFKMDFHSDGPPVSGPVGFSGDIPSSSKEVGTEITTAASHREALSSARCPGHPPVPQ